MPGNERNGGSVFVSHTSETENFLCISRNFSVELYVKFRLKCDAIVF